MKAHGLVRWLVLIILISFHAIAQCAEQIVRLNGGGHPPNVNEPIFPGVLNKLKQHEPFKEKTDEEIYQKIVIMRRAVLDAIDAARAEDPAIADCLRKLFEANRCFILFGTDQFGGRLRTDGSPDCNDFTLEISINLLPCDEEPFYRHFFLATTLIHEGRHARQDFRVDEAGLDPDQVNAARREKLQCNEIEAHEENRRILAEIDEVLDAIERGEPLPPNAKGLAKLIGEALANDPSLTDEQKRELADHLFRESSIKQSSDELVIECRLEAKRLFQEFLAGTLTKENLNKALATNGWFLDFGTELGTGPIAYFGDGTTKNFSQFALHTNRTFRIPGLDQLYAFSLLPGGRKGVFVGAETGTGDGIMLGYSDVDGDFLLDEHTRTELIRSLDLAGGVHLARNPANGVLMALNRSDNTLLRLPDTDEDLFPNFVSIAGEFTFERDDLLYLSFSLDGKTAYASSEFDPAHEGVILRATQWAVATAPDPNGYFAADGLLDVFNEEPAVPAFVGIPLNEQPFVWINGASGAETYLYERQGAKRRFLGATTLDEFGEGVIYLEYPLEAGMVLELEDEPHVLFSPLVRVELPHLNIARFHQRVVIDWPGFGYRLQQALQITGPFLNLEGASPANVWTTTNRLGFFRLQQEQGRPPKTNENPCPDGRLLVRHAYSECQSGGTWHVVEDAWYACPPDGQIKKFRVYDVDTGQPCTPTLPPPTPAGVRYRKVDSTCISPIDTGERVVLMECRNGMWRGESKLMVTRAG